MFAFMSTREAAVENVSKVKINCVKVHSIDLVKVVSEWFLSEQQLQQ
jgi:hypothetical protein